MAAATNQLNLFNDVLQCYQQGQVDNQTLYQSVAEKHRIDLASTKTPIGKDGVKHSVFARRLRWIQQDLRKKGLIERIDRGQWRLTSEGKNQLTQTVADKHLIAGSTDLGILIWCNSELSLSGILHEDVHLCLTSTPYLGIERSYGTHFSENDFLDFIIRVLTPIRKKMVPGANLALNLTNDSILRKRFGERSRYLEKLVLRLSDELELHLMDRLVWHAPDKPPKGYQVTHKRTHLTSRYEPILWFCNEPEHCLADNKRILVPYSKSMQEIIDKGGSQYDRISTDYHPNSRKGGFSVDHGGAIQGNVITIPTYCSQNRKVLKYARNHQLPTHGALFPVALAELLIKWLCPEGGTVIDPFGGYATVGAAAENTNRFWWISEWHWEYLKPALSRFSQRPGYWVNPLFDALSDPLVRKEYAH